MKQRKFQIQTPFEGRRIYKIFELNLYIEKQNIYSRINTKYWILK